MLALVATYQDYFALSTALIPFGVALSLNFLTKILKDF